MLFTLDQKKAHDPLRHISITANAGSGKTRVLVSRYCDLVELFGATPEKIAAITFTEKAASELRGKIAEELERRLSSDDHRAAWPRLKRARERFASAIVSTIHGFCSQLLREFPIEIGVTPNFGVTSGYERRRLAEESLTDAIETALSGDHHDAETSEAHAAESSGFELARKIGREKMETILRMMLDRREMIEYSRANGVLRLDADETAALWTAEIERAFRNLLLRGGIADEIRTLAEAMKPENAANVLGALAELETARSAEELIARASALATLLLTDAGKVRKRLYALKGEELEAFARHEERVQEAFKRAARLIDSSGDVSLHAEMFTDARALLAVLDDALARYEDRKARLNVLDFEDLQLRLLRALRDEGFRAAVADRFAHIMIDEFQDTNELQYAIARTLLAELTVGHLCIVGDTKQSIYGFRNADVEVFARAGREIGEANTTLGREAAPLRWTTEEITPANQEERLGVIKLTASFRLLPSICAFVNTVCRPVLVRPSGSQFGVDYEPLVCARRSDGRGAVEAILAAPPSEANDEESGEQPATEVVESIPEAEMIARRLRWLAAGEERVVWDTSSEAPGESPRASRYADMAILCRKRSQFPAIEAALRKYDIPFVTHGGSGFYKTQEIHDMLSYLRVLVNSRDDIAMIGLLRSPFFCVSDAELFRLSLVKGAEGRDIWSRAVRRAKDPGAEEALVRAIGMIEDDRAMAGRIPASLLLRRVLERTGWRGAAIGAERGEQNLANVDKLLQMAREYEARGFTSLFDFVERVSEMVEAEEMEGEAPLNTGRDAVRLMTMHAAKGLEFPVVVLPSLESPTRTSTEPFLDKDLGFGWTWRFNHEDYRPAITALMTMRAEERERAEEARLFYVALTRARDLLILSGTLSSKRSQSGTMLAWGLAPLVELPEENAELPLPPAELGFLESDGIGLRTERWEQSLRVHRTIAPPPAVETAGTGRGFANVDVRIGELPAHASGEIYSATQFMVYSQCPTKYYLKYRLGIPEELSAAYATDGHDSDDGTTFARTFRHVMREIDRALDPETGMLLRDATTGAAPGLDPLVRNALAMEPIAPGDHEHFAARLAATVERLFTAAPARALIAPPGARARTAYELLAPLGSETVMGQMDRVVEAADGTLSAVQFKTRRVEAGAITAAADDYRPQLRIYAWLLARLREQQRSVTCTVIFTEHPDHPQSFTFPRFEAMRIEETIGSAIDDIRAITYSGRRDLPMRTPHCPACAYWLEGRCLLEGDTDSRSQGGG